MSARSQVGRNTLSREVDLSYSSQSTIPNSSVPKDVQSVRHAAHHKLRLLLSRPLLLNNLILGRKTTIERVSNALSLTRDRYVYFTRKSINHSASIHAEHVYTAILVARRNVATICRLTSVRDREGGAVRRRHSNRRSLLYPFLQSCLMKLNPILQPFHHTLSNKAWIRQGKATVPTLLQRNLSALTCPFLRNQVSEKGPGCTVDS
jgi:hypothetical protein